MPHDEFSWYTVYPPSHRLAGQTVEVVPRTLLFEMTQRLAEQTSAADLEDAREATARAVELACEHLPGDVAADLRSAFLDLMERATRTPSDA